jgi:hypothetical protein
MALDQGLYRHLRQTNFQAIVVACKKRLVIEPRNLRLSFSVEETGERHPRLNGRFRIKAGGSGAGHNQKDCHQRRNTMIAYSADTIVKANK